MTVTSALSVCPPHTAILDRHAHGECLMFFRRYGITRFVLNATPPPRQAVRPVPTVDHATTMHE